MHQDILPHPEMTDILPCENFILRQGMVVLNRLFALLPLFLIDKIADKHIDGISAPKQLLELV